MRFFCNTLSLSLAFLLLCSCSKSIKGKLIDNFGQPISEAEIKIKDSGFTTTANSDGEFNLDYAPGKFEITFSKDGYVNVTRTLEITEKSDYPWVELS